MSEDLHKTHNTENIEEVATTAPAGTPIKPFMHSRRMQLKAFFKSLVATKKRFFLTVLCVVVLVVGVITLIPASRYAVFGLFIKKDISIKVIDATTKRPVSDARVSIGVSATKSDKDGNANLKDVAVGQYDLKVTKKYYDSYTSGYAVPILKAPANVTESLVANGRQVTFKIIDRISGDTLADASLEVSGTSARTDKSGKATVVVGDAMNIKGTVRANGYNDSDITLDTTGDVSRNTFTLTRSGRIVYLNNANGTIDVRRSNLDGTDGSVIVAGTGKEDKYSTALLSARDWQYSVLKASRDSTKEKLYLVTTKDGTLDDVDEGNADFTLIGWLGHTFYYVVDREGPIWNDHRSALKSYNADTRKLSTLDETSAAGSNFNDAVYQSFSSVYLLNRSVVYAKYWNAPYDSNLNDKSTTLYSIATDSAKKTAVKDYSSNNGYLSLSLYEPQGVYIRYTLKSDNQSQYYEYEDGDVKSVEAPQRNFFDHPTYLASPSDKQTFWYELRNGKNTLFIGDNEGQGSKQIATLSEYVPYGWYGDSDQYILFTKNGSELYIAPATRPITDNPLKITDYYKVQTYPGYGKGYGGQ